MDPLFWQFDDTISWEALDNFLVWLQRSAAWETKGSHKGKENSAVN
jgi:hypothetical protein